MPSNQDRVVFTYHTRVSVTPEQDQMLREYATRFGHVERTLYADLQKGKDAKELKSEYLARFGITARQFNALRIQLFGKIDAIREQIPVQIENLRGKSRKPRRPSPNSSNLSPARTSCIRNGGAWRVWNSV